MEQKPRLDNSRGGVVDNKILMILITFCGGDTGFLKCSVTETGTVVDELQQVRIHSCGDLKTHHKEAWKDSRQNISIHIMLQPKLNTDVIIIDIIFVIITTHLFFILNNSL